MCDREVSNNKQVEANIIIEERKMEKVRLRLNGI